MRQHEPITISRYLVVRADSDMRIVKGPPRLRFDEVAFPLTVTIPRSWGRVLPTRIDVSLPEPPEVRVTVGEPVLSPEDDDEDGDS